MGTIKLYNVTGELVNVSNFTTINEFLDIMRECNASHIVSVLNDNGECIYTEYSKNILLYVIKNKGVIIENFNGCEKYLEIF